VSKLCIFFNKSQDELIRSIFFNRVNESIIVVSVTKKDEYNSLKCRTVGLDLIQEAFNKLEDSIHLKNSSSGEGLDYFMSGKFKGKKLFRDY
jgi:hypothetical protein